MNLELLFISGSFFVPQSQCEQTWTELKALD